MQARATYDVDGWWGGTVSGKIVVVPAGIGDAFVQRAGGEPGVTLPDHLRAEKAVVAAEARVRVVQKSTGQPVVPRAIARADHEPVEVVGGGGWVHRLTIERSTWEIVGGWTKVGAGSGRASAPPVGTNEQQSDHKPTLPKKTV
jgi:hypothetical protein